MPDFIHYQVFNKVKTWGYAITKGFQARVAPLGKAVLNRGYTHIVAGLQFGALDVLKQVRAAGEPYIFVDRAYFGGGARSGRLRMTYGAYQQHWVTPGIFVRHDRNWGVELEPWQEGYFLMVVPPSPQVQDLYGIRWDAYMAKIQASTNRRIIVSPKSDRESSPITERLKGCHAVVTWTSNVAVDAICAGVPAFVCPDSAAAPVAGKLAAFDFENVVRPERSAWLASLSRGQFTLDEVASGAACKALTPAEELA